MTSLASAEAPPDVFARAIGERPRAGSFPVPNVGGVDGLFSTAWLLVHAAGESGRLRRLIAELEDLAKADVPHAGPLLLLARIADHSASSDELRNLINKQLTPSPSEQTNDMLDWALAGAACLDRADLLAAGQQIFETMLERIGPAPSQHALPFLRRARAIAIFKQHDDAGPALLWDPGLKFWIPAGEENAVRSATGAVHEIWLAHEGHIVHVAGPRNDYLCFRYPLAGTFEFQVEAQTGGKEATCGNIAFGGLAYGVDGNGNEFRVWGLDMGQMIARPFPYVRKEQSPTYQRLILRSSETGVEYLMNGHPVWTDSLLNTPSPWLALRAFGDCIPAFRNLRLTGNPVIPREVRMSDGDSMRGWLTQFYTCKASRAVPVDDVNTIINPPPQQADQPGANAPPDKAQFDWFMHNGVIHGAKRDESFRAAAQSRLTYFRPLQDGESIRYEFLYEPGKHEVHPALGRLAFLIEPVGVRVHWLTGGETDWTGLPENNATIEPLNRRGPRILPLNPGQWNRLTVALGDNTLRLMLNDVECYSRNMEAENSRRFSLYYDRSRSAAQVRDVVLHGDWPEQLTAEERSDLLAPRQTVD
jgi:hypothetical protein